MELERSAVWMELKTRIVVKTEGKVNERKQIFEHSLVQWIVLGKYCCTNEFNNPTCEDTTTLKPVITTKTTTTTKPTITTKKPPYVGPTYLPLPTVKTTRSPSTTNDYTWGTRGTNTYTYSWSFGPWSRDPRLRTVIYSTTPKPLYHEDGSNVIVYNTELEDNSV